MENKITDIISLKLSSHKTPVFKEEKQKDWVIYGAERDGGYYNNYGGYLNYLYNKTSKHNAFINGKVHFICGNGVAFDTTNLSVSEIAVVDSFLNKNNSNGDNLRDVIRKCTLDKKNYGGYYIEVILSKGGLKYEYLHMSWNSLRASKDGDGYFYSKDWTKQKQNKEDTGLEFIPNFDPEKKNIRSIHCFKEYRPDLDAYPLPDFIASVVYAEIDVELSNYRLNAIKSGFNAGTIVSFNNGRPTQEDKDETVAAFEEKFKGTDVANSILFSWAASKDSAPTITRLSPQNVDDQLNSLNDQVTQELIIGHNITNPLLVGVKTAGELGNKDQTIDSFDLWNHGYIIPNKIEIENDFNYLLGLNGFNNRLYLKDVKPFEERVTSEQKWSIMTPNEQREAAGLEELEEEPTKMVSSTVHRFSVDDEEEEFAENDAEVFRQYGEDIDGYDFIAKGQSFHAIDKDEVFALEVKNYGFDILDGEVKLLYKNIIELLTKDPLLSNEAMAKALNVNVSRVNVAVNRLVDDGALKLSEKSSGTQSRKPTAKAEKIVDKQGSSVGELKIMYTYEARPGLKPILDTTRPFCKKLINAKKLYSRQQIETISGIVGYDVWTKRGGWWTQKGGAVTTPFCRHVWVQNIVRKK